MTTTETLIEDYLNKQEVGWFLHNFDPKTEA